ncbi:oligosaccharide flippase family protein [Halomonas sp. ZH2S]|uniref:Oligosaccharide flippase family protein n=2 Tax=Vreelandella zhuhanensis TaxID=2684210 RepID=A0A7X3KQ82_9GAMM|nr:oligosaccharide flippase family protein [Halomonas zhuhanensis]
MLRVAFNSKFLLRVTNIGLRGVTLLSKFLLIFILARFLEPAEVALYGLVVATVGYSLYGLGFDFYSYSTREILGSDKEHWARLLRDQSVFFGLVYCLVIPLLLLVFYNELLPWSVAPWFFIIVVLEHLAQELNRLLVAISRQLLASVILFLRSGLWALFVALVFWLSEDMRSIDLVMTAWALGAAAACFLGASALMKLDRNSLKSRVDWSWIKRGIVVALPLLVATLAVRGVFTIDRYWVQAIAGADILAAYVLYFGVANAIISFLDAGVFVFLYPKMISASRNKNRKEFDKGMRQLLVQTVIVTIAFSGLAALLIHPLLGWLDRPVYTENVTLLYLLLIAIGVYAVSMIPHYGMYAMSFDRHIIISHVLALPSFVVLAYVFSEWSAKYAVPLALCGSFGCVLAYKTAAYLSVKRKKNWELAEQQEASV